MKKKIAIFTRSNSTYSGLCDKDGMSWMDDDEDYVRVTETVEVHFEELPKQEILNQQVEGIDKNILKLEGQIEALKNQKKELLCIEHQVA